jgi:hypothetical protein
LPARIACVILAAPWMTLQAGNTCM